MRTQEILVGIKAATEDDWHTEYLAPILAFGSSMAWIRQSNINTYSSQHTDSIDGKITAPGRRFITEVDSSSVMISTSTDSQTVSSMVWVPRSAFRPTSSMRVARRGLGADLRNMLSLVMGVAFLSAA